MLNKMCLLKKMSL